MKDGTTSFGRPLVAGLVLVLCAYLLFAGLGARAVEVRDISRTAEIARETLEGGRWLAPTREGELETEKPPFYVWVVAALGAATGRVGPLESRVPAAAASLGSVLLVFFWAWRRRDLATASLAAALLATGELFVELARISRVDSTFAFFLAVSTVAAHEADRGERLARRLGLAFVSGAALAAAMVTKSPLLGMVLHLAAVGGSILVDVTAEKPWRATGSTPVASYAKRLLAPGAALPPLVGLGLFACWFVPFWRSLTDLERERTWLQFKFENLDRGVSGSDKPHSVAFYVPRILGQAAPSGLLALVLLATRLAGERGRAWFSPAQDPSDARFERFAQSWWLFPFLVLSIASGKHVRYLLPCLHGAAVAGALAWRALEDDERPRLVALRRGMGWFAAAALGIATLALPAAAVVALPEALPDACWLAVVAAAGAALAWRAGTTGRFALEPILLAVFLGQVAWNGVVLPSAAYARTRTPVQQLIQRIPEGVRNQDLVVFQVPKQGHEGETGQRRVRLLFGIYRDGGLPVHATTPEKLLAELASPERLGIVEDSYKGAIAPIESALETVRTIDVPDVHGKQTFFLVRRRR